MAKPPIPGQLDLFENWLSWIDEQPAVPATVREETVEPDVPLSPDQRRFQLALTLAEQLNRHGEITSSFLTEAANRAFAGTQASGAYTSKDAYDAMEAAVNLHLAATESPEWTRRDAESARAKAHELTTRVQRLPTQTRRDPETEEYQQFSTPPALAFVANWVANVSAADRMLEPSAGTGDLAIWSRIAGAEIILNELAPRRQALLSRLYPEAVLFRENAEQLDNVLPAETVPTVIVMNPPFSSTAGRVPGQRDSANGARHIEQALKRLAPGGRLVAIVGQGMAADRPAFRDWWQGIERQYTVRANIGINGREYAKYGTTFDNRILVIDKTGPSTEPVLTGQVESVADLPALLESIRHERQPIQQRPIEPSSRGPAPAEPDSLRPGDGIGGPGPDSGSRRPESGGPAGGDSGAGAPGGEAPTESGARDVADDGIGTGRADGDGLAGGPGRSGGDAPGGVDRLPEGAGAVTVEAVTTQATEFTDSVFARYTPQRLNIPNAHPHPGKLVQSAAMAAVEPPAPIYTPALPARVVQHGLLSIAQLETVVYAGQAHSELLPNGSRKGYFIGDGTGVGKGREISGIILDNLAQGRRKAVWVSFNEGLINDARRDFAGVGGDPDKIFFQGKTKAGNALTQPDGILFTTYATLRGGEKKQATDLGQGGGQTRLQQIVDWLGQDFDGVIAFDEAHSMGNAVALKATRGLRKPSQQALAGINLQRELPQARVVYVSATGATEVSNLSYADRLGLWGEGTPFADVNAFIANVSAGGIAAMELISRDMKAMGVYLARSLSYDGVSYERLEHTLTPLQEDIYNELAGAWQIVLQNVNQALEVTQAGKNGQAKSAAMAQFWGAHQRFFNQIITAMQTPTVIDHIREQIDAGHAAVIQLVNTNEAAQERIIAEATAQQSELEDLDFTPRQMLMDYVRNGFPVAAFEATTDANGNKVFVPVRDSEGNPVFDREAIALRDALLATLQQIRVPENPLDSIVNAFGPEQVAEVTGRGRRFVQTWDEAGNLKVTEEKRGKHSSRLDAELFQADQKKILIFSGAGGTGYSFHADNTAENRRKRIHYILQPGWRADAAVQGFGRTHRTNQASEPHYVLPTTNLAAQKRFVSSIARRLDQLGALTRGQRQATSQGLFTAADNLESDYARVALHNFFNELYRGRTPLDFQDVTQQMGLKLLDSNGGFSESSLPEIPQFLNRLLSLKTDRQNAVFQEFETRLVEAVEYAKQHGFYDEGLQTLKAAGIRKTRDDVAYQDAKTGAVTRYVELAVTTPLHYWSWEEITRIVRNDAPPGPCSGWYVSEHGKTQGEVFYLKDRGEHLNSKGESVHRGIIHGIRQHGHRYIDNADVIHRGWDDRRVGDRYQRVTLARAIGAEEAEGLWQAQLAAAPPTQTETIAMLVGVILPIWDRVAGAETIYRLRTDDGEQLLGRLLDGDAARQTLKNLGLDSSATQKTPAELFAAIQSGQRAVLSNGWSIALAKVNYEDRIEVKKRGAFSPAEIRLLATQGAFVERINWTERVFIPTGDLEAFTRITASKPVVELFEQGRTQEGPEAEPSIALPESVGMATGSADPPAREDDPPRTTKGLNAMVSPNAQKKSFAEIVAEKLIEQLKQGTAPWQKPWSPGDPEGMLPYNASTGKRYQGINSLHLMSEGHGDPRWLTYKQAQALGGQVRKGEKGTPIQYWKFTEERPKLDEDGKPVLDENGEPLKVTVRLERPRSFGAVVFNASQIEGLPELVRPPPAWDPIERAEAILAGSGAAIHHGESNKAFYRPLTDSIHLPHKAQFGEAGGYYATALHELGHWTGHPSRLDRDLAHPFGSDGYAREELRAEIASLLLGAELQIGHDPGQHAAYVKSWISILENEPTELLRAASDAEKILRHVLSLEQAQTLEQAPLETLDRPQASGQEPDMPALPLPLSEPAPNVAEVWTLEHLRRGSLGRALEGATREQIDRAAEILDSMVPLNTQNEFWRRHELPFDVDALQARLDRAMDDLDARRLNTSAAETQAKNEGLGAAQRQGEGQGTAAGQAPGQGQATSAGPAAQRVYLAVPYHERQQAKAAGARWDKAAKAWYVGPGANPDRLARWRTDPAAERQRSALPPREEFAEALRSVGCVVAGEHPVMDGQRHRIATEFDGPGERSGFYVGHLDGWPAGFVQNHRTGESLRWKSKGYHLEPAAKAALQAEATAKLAAREAEQAKVYEATALRLEQQIAGLTAAGGTPYQQGKGIAPQAGVLTDEDGRTTYIPAYDAADKLWTVQYIQEDGVKRFAKDSRKEGCFHAVGGLEALAAAPALVIAEGYATAATVAEVLGQPTVAAFDAGNLLPVAQALHERYPDKPVLIVGDDDRHLTLTHGRNRGRADAEAAARAVGGQAVFPVFAPGEAGYPEGLPPVTPETYRAHRNAARTLADPDAAGLTAGQTEALRAKLLTDEQLGALATMKARSDFNDLATNSRLGREAVRRQLGPVLELALKASRRQALERVQERGARVNGAKEEGQPRRVGRER
jgi:antirestriction protein ArdC/phage/plasmid primase-like uncharacterized protein